MDSNTPMLELVVRPLRCLWKSLRCIEILSSPTVSFPLPPYPFTSREHLSALGTTHMIKHLPRSTWGARIVGIGAHVRGPRARRRGCHPLLTFFPDVVTSVVAWPMICGISRRLMSQLLFGGVCGFGLSMFRWYDILRWSFPLFYKILNLSMFR
jgi:hypothetical protein